MMDSRKTSQQIQPGNLTIHPVSDIGQKHRMKLFMPSTAFIGLSEHQNAKDRFIYTDPRTQKLVVKKQAITQFHMKLFIDEHMHVNSAPPKPADKRGRNKAKPDGIIPPKYLMKIIEKNSRDATARVYFCKNQLLADLSEYWGRCDLIVQEYVIQKTLQPCIYRFYRNERNVYRAECIINKKSILSDAATSQTFQEMYQETFEERMQVGLVNGVVHTHNEVKREAAIALSTVQRTIQSKIDQVVSPQLGVGRSYAGLNRNQSMHLFKLQTVEHNRNSRGKARPTGNDHGADEYFLTPQQPRLRNSTEEQIKRRGSHRGDQLLHKQSRMQQSSMAQLQRDQQHLRTTATSGFAAGGTHEGLESGVQSGADQTRFFKSMTNFRNTARDWSTGAAATSSKKPVKEPALKPHWVEGQREREAELREKLDTNAIFMEKERKKVTELFATKLHNRFPQHVLQDLFTVDTYGGSDTVKVKCMPNSYPQAVNAIDTIYKVFSQMYIDSKNEGTLNCFVTDFLQDELGRFYFLKIHDFGADGKPVCTTDWKMSKQFVDRKQVREEKLVKNQRCEGRLICNDPASCAMLEKVCREHNYWQSGATNGGSADDDQAHSKIFPKVPIKLVTKYAKEIEFGRKLLSLVDNEFDITPFYPLLGFPRRDDVNYQKFEKRMHIAASSFKQSKCATPAKASKPTDIDTLVDEMDKDGKRSSVRLKQMNLYSAQKRVDTQGDRQSIGSMHELQMKREASTYSNVMQHDAELSDEERPVCFHCAKLIQMFKLRHKAITFPNSQVKSTLDGLRLSQKSNWDVKDVEYVMLMYLTCNQRQQKVFENINFMEKNIQKRVKQEKYKRERIEARLDVKRKTKSCKNREKINSQQRKQIEFESVVGKTAQLQRIGQIDSLTPMERNKLFCGTDKQKHMYGRYGLDLTQPFSTSYSQQFIPPLGKRNHKMSMLDTDLVQSYQELERDLARRDSSACRDSNYNVPIIEDYTENNSQYDKMESQNQTADYNQNEAFNDELSKVQKPYRNAVSPNGRTSTNFETNKQQMMQNEVQMLKLAGNNGSSTNHSRTVAFENILAKNRIRPMTSNYGQKFNSVGAQTRQDKFSRIKSAKALIKDGNGTVNSCRNYSNHLKRISAKTVRQTKEQEYRLVQKKNTGGGVKSSNMLLRLMNQNISENIAKNPYARELSNTDGIKLKAISRRSSMTNGGGSTDKALTQNRFFSAVGAGKSASEEDYEMDASTQPPRTEGGEANPSASAQDASTIAQPATLYHTHSNFNDAAANSGGLSGEQMVTIDSMQQRPRYTHRKSPERIAGLIRMNSEMIQSQEYLTKGQKKLNKRSSGKKCAEIKKPKKQVTMVSQSQLQILTNGGTADQYLEIYKGSTVLNRYSMQNVTAKHQPRKSDYTASTKNSTKMHMRSRTFRKDNQMYHPVYHGSASSNTISPQLSLKTSTHLSKKGSSYYKQQSQQILVPADFGSPTQQEQQMTTGNSGNINGVTVQEAVGRVKI